MKTIKATKGRVKLNIDSDAPSQDEFVVDAWIIGNVAVHHPYEGTEYGMKRWELTHIPTGNRIVGDTVKKLCNARRLAAIFNRAFGTITDKETLIHNDRAKRTYYRLRSIIHKYYL